MASESVVDKAFAAALYSAPGRRRDDGGLDAGAALLAASAQDRAEAFRRGAGFVRRAWERGWQPADLVRMVRRGLDPVHVSLAADLIRDETARYGSGPADLPPRWREQLDGLPAGGPPRDPFLYATALLELYRLLLGLPAIEPAGPVPGTAVHIPPPHPEARVPARIRALLAKAEATGYPAEAEALSAKAQELMARHSLDAAALSGHTPTPDTPVTRRLGIEPPYETAQAILLHAVAGANHCRAVWSEPFGFSTVVGYAPDLEAVEVLYVSLLVQGTAAMTVAEAEQRAAGRRRTKTFRQAFQLAYADRIGHRLAATAHRAADEAPRDLLPAVAARDVAVTAHAEELFPDTTTTRVRGADDLSGRHHGARAADRATGL
ncbi:hypothetical protein DSC45_25125 [Streptomyces sp. YIM 130001]|uniref:DUF2786 domain-containing protein n=1 Tax=Streptomyces sp. YIM 130001 TaxID=2259644 RepID=UPI000E64869D|nr:DUF2786 domain-containing protein [Streptomyces sp. YIM 130001]RII13137.1 hypothetical protein DSC45_25125 [Streptomyces sp. YIM 130001]